MRKAVITIKQDLKRDAFRTDHIIVTALSHQKWNRTQTTAKALSFVKPILISHAPPQIIDHVSIYP